MFVKRNSVVGSAIKHAMVSIGERTTIGYNTIIMASKSISIGSDCMIAPNVYIVDSNHGMLNDQSISYNKIVQIVLSLGIMYG